MIAVAHETDAEDLESASFDQARIHCHIYGITNDFFFSFFRIMITYGRNDCIQHNGQRP